MKRKNGFTDCIVLGTAFLLVFQALTLSGCRIILVDPDGSLTGTAAESSSVLYTYRIDIEPYRAAMYTADSACLVLVNKSHTVGAEYAPDRLSRLDGSLTLGGKEVLMQSTAAQAAEALIRELWAYGWTDIHITSGYRTYSYQSSLFNGYIADERSAHPTWTYEQAVEQVLTYSARPGTSEHQTGLCMDLIAESNPVLDESFAEQACYGWLEENAHKFGFILRFPDGMESITGYNYEPWHYRFVGVETATEIYQRGITLEQYLGQ